MKILFCGDIVGRAGRDIVIQLLPDLRKRLELDFIIVNGENAANGFGITKKICSELYAAGADVITTGNHVWDQRDIIGQIDADAKLLRPANFPLGTPGRGANIYETINGRRVLVINIMCRLFMDPLDDPFSVLERLLSENTLGGSVDAIVIDVHGEASSEKMAIGHAFDGRVSLIVGTHTHVPTADSQILDGGTAYQTDAGMCGDYDSIIGMRKAPAIERFRRKIPGERLSPASGPADLCGVFIEIDDRTGLADYVAPLRIGNRLLSTWPDRYEDR